MFEKGNDRKKSRETRSRPSWSTAKQDFFGGGVPESYDYFIVSRFVRPSSSSTPFIKFEIFTYYVLNIRRKICDPNADSLKLCVIS